MLKLTSRGKKGIFQISGSLANERVRESTGTNSRPHAEATLAKRQQEILDRYTWGEQRTATFAEAVVLYLEGGGEDRFMGKLIDHFGTMRLSEITSMMVAKFAASAYPNSGLQGINRQVYTPIIAVFRTAAGAQPPLCAMPMFKRPKLPKRKAVTFARDEHIVKLLPSCSIRLKAAVLTITLTAARASEACRLRDDDVDWDDHSAILRETKNGEPRRVKLPQTVVDALIPLRGTQGPLFGFKTRHSLNQAIERASRRAGLPYLSSHKIGRHAFSARLLRQGKSGKVVQEAGGWKSARLFDETYKHLERSHVDEVVASSDTDLARMTKNIENVVEFPQDTKPKSTMSR